MSENTVPTTDVTSIAERSRRIARAKALLKTATSIVDPLENDGAVWEAKMSLLNAYSSLVLAEQEWWR